MKKTKILISTILGVATIGIASQQLYANSEDRISGHNYVNSAHNSQYPPTARALSTDNALHPMLLKAMNHEATSAAFLVTARTHGNRTQINRAEKAWQDANSLVVSVIADLGGTDSRAVGIMHDSGMSYEQIGYDLRIYQDQIVLDGRGNRNDQVVVNRGPNDHGLDIHDEHMGDSGGQAGYSNVQRPVGYQSGAENSGHYQQHSSTGSSQSYGNHGMGH